MGFRSTFVSEHVDGVFPEWFVEKWSDRIHFNGEDHLPIASKKEAKLYYSWRELPEDLARASEEMPHGFVVVFMHECRGVSRLHVEEGEAYWSEVDDSTWHKVDRPTHDYCYGCSEPSGQGRRVET